MNFTNLSVKVSVWLLVLLTMEASRAETLSEKLKDESPLTLAEDSRQHGDAVRGSILYTSPKLACTQCHATGGVDLAGPNLTRLGEQISDVDVVRAILTPSLSIRKGYESTRILTVDGEVLTGRIVSSKDESLTLQTATPGAPAITLKLADIEERFPSKQSAMPDNIVDQLKNRREFLDLARYVMQLTAMDSTGSPSSGTPPVTTPTAGQTLSPELQGVVLLNEFNCAACHRDDLPSHTTVAKHAPDLRWTAENVDPHHLLEFIAAPRVTKPGTLMPDVMAELSNEDRQLAAKQLTHYSVSLGERDFTRQDIDTDAAERGDKLFHSVGCVACHSPRDESGRETLPGDSVPLGRIPEKYSVASLASFLENPHQARPSERMPNMRLTHWEAIDLASYLCLDATNEWNDTFAVDLELAAQGQKLLHELRCVNCHTEQRLTPPNDPAPTDLLSLSEVNPERGCLSDARGTWPQFDMTSEQRDQMRAAISRPSKKLSDRDQIAVTLTAFRCLNCHRRDELGGVASDRDTYFQTTNPNLGPQGRLPPTLTQVGAKLKPTWLRQVLVSGRAIRPYMQTRMPQYHAKNVAHLVDQFAAVDELPAISHGTFTDEKATRQVGAQLAGTDGLNCIACHTFQLKQSANMPAVDLTEMAARLQKDWFYHYMLDPQRLSPNTVMPTFWPQGQAMRDDILEGDANNQVEALWLYLLDGRQAATPRGLIQEPIRLLAKEEAVMLRRAYPGIGKRGIGVGYSGGLNIAYDAEQMRLATIWKGVFADPAGVWRSQGHGVVRPLGDDLVEFAKGPELEKPQSPWIVDDGRPPHHQFRGYSLDHLRRPTFRYSLGEIHVSDYFVNELDATSSAPMLRRTITLVSDESEGQVTFRVATGKSIARTGERAFEVDDGLLIRLSDGHPIDLVASVPGQPSIEELRVSLTISKSPTVLTIQYIWGD